MIRPLLILFLFVMICTVITHPAKAVGLKNYSVLEGTSITVGDIFSDVHGEKALRVLGPAPLPGKDMILNARTLMRIALALDLSWRPTTSSEQVTLSRAATIVKPDIIKEALTSELTAHGVRGKFNIVSDRVMDSIILPASETKDFEIVNLTVRRESGRFEAVIYAPSQDNPLHRSQVSGKIERLIDVPVLRDTLRSGAVIGARDIDFIEIPERQIKAHMIMDADSLIGMTPRKVVMADEPIKDNQVEYPQIISRGNIVTMILKNGGLQLTAQGKAMENGAQGDLIRVVNAGSNKTLQGLVTNTNEVTINSF